MLMSAGKEISVWCKDKTLDAGGVDNSRFFQGNGAHSSLKLDQCTLRNASSNYVNDLLLAHQTFKANIVIALCRGALSQINGYQLPCGPSPLPR